MRGSPEEINEIPDTLLKLYLLFPASRMERKAKGARQGVSPVEATFPIEAAAGGYAFRISFLRGMSGIEAIVRVLPEFRSVIARDSIGLDPGPREAMRHSLPMRGGICLVSSAGGEGVATTIRNGGTSISSVPTAGKCPSRFPGGAIIATGPDLPAKWPSSTCSRPLPASRACLSPERPSRRGFRESSRDISCPPSPRWRISRGGGW